jgi:hypothetical protein
MITNGENLNFLKKVSAIAILVVVAVAVCSVFVVSRSAGPTVENASFMFHDGEGPNAGGEFARELGVNTIPIYLDHGWSMVEPADNVWNWSDVIPGNMGEYGHSMLRIGALHILSWNPTAIPAWVDKDNLDGVFKEEYGDYVRHVVEYVVENNIPIDIYLVELEANYAGHEISGNDWITNAWIIDWIKWEVGIIKSIDPTAKIVIPLTSTEFRPEESLDNTGDRGKILVSDFVERMIQENVQFDAFGFNVASGAYSKVDDWTVLQSALDNWSSIDKEIFVWSLGYPANNDDNLPFNNPRADGYSEEWQREQYVNSLRILIENPKVIGASIGLYDYQEAGWAAPFHWGLVAGDRATPENLSKRTSFDAVKDYWHENCR